MFDFRCVVNFVILTCIVLYSICFGWIEIFQWVRIWIGVKLFWCIVQVEAAFGPDWHKSLISDRGGSPACLFLSCPPTWSSWAVSSFGFAIASCRKFILLYNLRPSTEKWLQRATSTPSFSLLTMSGGTSLSYAGSWSGHFERSERTPLHPRARRRLKKRFRKRMLLKANRL